MGAKRAIEPRDLYSVRLVSDAQISPDGTRVAFVLRRMDDEKNDYISNVYVVDLDGAVTQFTSGDKDSSPRWSPDGKWLAFMSARDGKAQVHIMSTSGGESVALTDRKLGAGVPSWSPDSARIAFTGQVSVEGDDGTEKEEKKTAKSKIVERSSYKLDGAGYIGDRRKHLFVIDVAERTVEQFTEGDFHNDSIAWSPDGEWIAFASNRSPRWDVSLESAVYVMPSVGGEARQVTNGGSFNRPVFSPDGRRLAFAGTREAEAAFVVPQRIFTVDLSGEDLRDELAGWDGSLGNQVTSDVAISADQFSPQLQWREDGIHFLGCERGVTNVYCHPGGTRDGVRLVTCGRHAVMDYSIAKVGTVAFVASDPTHPAEVFLQHDGEGRRLTHQNDALLEEIDVREPERLCFVGANGEESEGWLLAPGEGVTGAGSPQGAPLLLYIHGGPQTAHGESFFFEYQYLASKGFGVFYPNIHGSSSYGRDYQTSIRGDWGNLDFQDVLAGINEAASRPWVDRDRLGIAGGSYGGYMTSWVIGHSNQFKAAVVERCLCNLLSFYGSSDIGWMWNRQAGYYPEENVEKLWDMSPIKYVEDIQTPTLVVHSEGDDRTPIEQGEQMFNALRRLGKETKFVMFPEESHGLSRGGKPSRRVERLSYIEDWFETHLGPITEPGGASS